MRQCAPGRSKTLFTSDRLTRLHDSTLTSDRPDTLRAHHPTQPLTPGISTPEPWAALPPRIMHCRPFAGKAPYQPRQARLSLGRSLAGRLICNRIGLAWCTNRSSKLSPNTSAKLVFSPSFSRACESQGVAPIPTASSNAQKAQVIRALNTPPSHLVWPLQCKHFRAYQLRQMILCGKASRRDTAKGVESWLDDCQCGDLGPGGHRHCQVQPSANPMPPPPIGCCVKLDLAGNELRRPTPAHHGMTCPRSR